MRDPEALLKEYYDIWPLKEGAPRYIVDRRIGKIVQALAPPSRLPTDSTKRKKMPIASGVLDYFPDALAAIAECSLIANEQHSPGAPLHWARGKSGDEADALMRHFMERGGMDKDGIRHSTKVAWRALALLQKELEQAHGLPISRGSKP